MEHIHFSYGEFGQCEQCANALTEENKGLQAVHFWYVKSNGNRIAYYLYVCTTCFDTRKLWCKHIFPEHCEICNQPIEDDDYFFDKKITSVGLKPNEKCNVICGECHKNSKEIE